MNHRLSLAALTLVAGCRSDKQAEGPMERAGKHIDHAAVTTEHALEKAAKKTGKAAEKAAQTTGEALERAGKRGRRGSAPCRWSQTRALGDAGRAIALLDRAPLLSALNFQQ